MSNQLLVSVITPSYNQAPYLEATISSVLEQDYPHIEYIVMDGGSTDGSVDIIRRYQDRLAYWTSEPDNGQAHAINRGFGLATGHILAWLNSDDTYEPGAIKRVIETFKSYPAAELVYGEGWYVDEEGQRIQPCHFVRRSFQAIYIVNKNPILQPAAFWRRGLWNKVGPLDQNLHWVFDWEWFIRASRQTPFQYVPHFLANYRIHSEAKTRTGGMARRMEHARVTRKYGGWWHPNHVVQQARHVTYRAEQLVASWPKPMAAPIARLAFLPQLLLERVLHGMYMR